MSGSRPGWIEGGWKEIRCLLILSGSGQWLWTLPSVVLVYELRWREPLTRTEVDTDPGRFEGQWWMAGHKETGASITCPSLYRQRSRNYNRWAHSETCNRVRRCRMWPHFESRRRLRCYYFFLWKVNDMMMTQHESDSRQSNIWPELFVSSFFVSLFYI